MVRLLTIKEAGKVLSVSRWTVYRYIRHGLLKSLSLPDNRLRVATDDLTTFIRGLKTNKVTVHYRKGADEIGVAMHQIEHYEQTGKFEED